MNYDDKSNHMVHGTMFSIERIIQVKNVIENVFSFFRIFNKKSFFQRFSSPMYLIFFFFIHLLRDYSSVRPETSDITLKSDFKMH